MSIIRFWRTLFYFLNREISAPIFIAVLHENTEKT